MDTLVAYLLKSVLSAGIFVTYYRFFLRNRRIHSFNRFYLLAALLFSLGFPLLNYNWITLTQGDPWSLKENDLGFAREGILFVCSALVSMVLFITLLLKIIWIYRVRRRCPAIKKDGFYLIETELRQAPFSFLDNLFWRKSISPDDENGKKIFAHELAHIRGKHTYDKLFSQLLVCVFWMNPFYWVIQRELSLIHEFIADENSVEDGDTTSFALMLLGCHNEGSYLAPSHGFFRSPVSRRLYMITVPKEMPFSKARRVSVLPVALLIIVLFSIGLKQKDGRSALERQAFAIKQAAEQKQMRR